MAVCCWLVMVVGWFAEVGWFTVALLLCWMVTEFSALLIERYPLVERHVYVCVYTNTIETKAVKNSGGTSVSLPPTLR